MSKRLLLNFFDYNWTKLVTYAIFSHFQIIYAMCNHIKLIMDAMFCYNVGIGFLFINATKINNILHILQMSRP
jgi:hypothetical protein